MVKAQNVPKPAVKKVKTASTPKQSSDKEARNIHAIDVWKNTPQAECISCNQKTSEIDRNSHPNVQKYLHWVQSKKNAKVGKKVYTAVPQGNECYPCFKRRRKHFPGMSQQILCGKRSENKTVDGKPSEYGKFQSLGIATTAGQVRRHRCLPGRTTRGTPR